MNLINRIKNRLYKQPKTRFCIGQPIRLEAPKMVRLGGILNTTEATRQVCIKEHYILQYHGQSETDYRFIVKVNAEPKSEIRNNTLILISKTSFENLKYKEL